MLYWALVFLIVAIIAAIFGFGGVAVAAAGIAKLLFFIFLVVFIITLITGLTRRGHLDVSWRLAPSWRGRLGSLPARSPRKRGEDPRRVVRTQVLGLTGIGTFAVPERC